MGDRFRGSDRIVRVVYFVFIVVFFRGLRRRGRENLKFDHFAILGLSVSFCLFFVAGVTPCLISILVFFVVASSYFEGKLFRWN